MTAFSELVSQVAALDPFPNGITPVDILQLPDPLDLAVRKIMRQGPKTAADLMSEIGLSENETQELAELLVLKGFLQSEELESSAKKTYKVFFARMRGRNIPLDL